MLEHTLPYKNVPSVPLGRSELRAGELSSWFRVYLAGSKSAPQSTNEMNPLTATFSPFFQGVLLPFHHWLSCCLSTSMRVGCAWFGVVLCVYVSLALQKSAGWAQVQQYRFRLNSLSLFVFLSFGCFWFIFCWFVRCPFGLRCGSGQCLKMHCFVVAVTTNRQPELHTHIN